MTTVRYRVVFGSQTDAPPTPRDGLPRTAAVSRRVGHGRSRAAVTPPAGVAPTRPDTAGGQPVSRIARMLALGYRVRRLVESGELADSREAAVRLGVPFSALTNLTNLTYLAPAIQERILAGELVVSERRLRAVCRVVDWREQEAAVADDGSG